MAKVKLTIDLPASSGFTPRYLWAIDAHELISLHAIVDLRGGLTRAGPRACEALGICFRLPV